LSKKWRRIPHTPGLGQIYRSMPIDCLVDGFRSYGVKRWGLFNIWYFIEIIDDSSDYQRPPNLQIFKDDVALT